MGQYRLTLAQEAESQLLQLKKAGNKSLMKKISALFAELEEHPRSGTGQPEQLKYNYAGFWSRRISKKSRLVYSIAEEDLEVTIYSLIGHYDDK